MTELLSPVGDFETLAAAIKAKADAVYFGIVGLNMRTNSARNFKIEDLPAVAKKCHENNVKCYLTLNTTIYDHELDRLKRILQNAKNAGVDAVIAVDFAVISLANKLGIDVHVSTQASITNSESITFYSQFSPRIILARETTLDQVKEMKKYIEENRIEHNGKLVELETFVHGALCVAVSGRCFMSQFHNRLSANRGQCLHECRKLYKITDIEDPRREFVIDDNYVMSPKDLCALPILDKLVDAGIDCVKIEGRAKGAEYVYITTKVYREALDAIKNNEFTKDKIAVWLEELQSVHNRGFSDNFFMGVPTNDAWANTYGSIQSHVKKTLGKVSNYYPKQGVAAIECIDRGLNKGEELLFTGPTTGFVKTKADEIHTDDGILESAPKGTIISVKVPEIVRKNDRVFIWCENKIDPTDELIKRIGVHEPFKTIKQNKKNKDAW